MLGGDALLADPDLLAFASVNTSVGGTADPAGDGGTSPADKTDAASSAGGRHPYLTYSVGVE